MIKIKTVIPLIFLLFLGLLTSYRLIRPGYFSMQDDVQVFRLQQLDLCLKDGQIPCRYIKDGGMGYGYPLYNYYSPLPYYIGEVFHLTGLSYIDSVKAVFILANFLAAIGIFLYTSTLFSKSGALISTTLYSLAPYRAVDAYVRGAIAELLAISIIPYIFYFITKKNKSAFTLSIVLILLCHNLFALVAIPLALVYILLTSPKNIKEYLVPLITSFGIAAFFIIPAIFEKNLVTVDTMTKGYFYYVNHFATLRQLFLSRFWGYGASLWGPQDDMSFQIGFLQWIVPLAFWVLLLIKRKTKQISTISFFTFMSVLSLFLTHSRSTFIWQLIPLMAYFQFPWRFLGFAIFGLSVVSGAISYFFANTYWEKFVTSVIIIMAVVINLSYFHEDLWYPTMTDNQKLSGDELVRQSAAGLSDYWPKAGRTAPVTYSPQTPEISPNLSATVKNYTRKSNNISLDIHVVEDNSLVTIPTVYFPNWKLYIDNQLLQIKPTSDLGLISFVPPVGEHHIRLIFTNTPIRSISNMISLLTLTFFIIKQTVPRHTNVNKR